jgi:hypothetical protein
MFVCELYLAKPVVAAYANDNDAFVPELWAQEGLAILEESMVMARMVHRDFQNQVAEYGDVVNTRRPGEFKIRRKTDADSVVAQDASATNVQVPLNQHIYNSFVIKDGEASKSFQELVSIYMLPAMQVIARSVDRVILGQVHQFLGGPTGRVGRLLNLSADNSYDYVLEARRLLNVNKAYETGRNLMLSPTAETALLKNTMFVKANERGDGGSALENARLGRIGGFDSFMGQNVNDILDGSCETATGTITNALAAGGSGSQACTITGYNVVVGEYAVVEGNDQPTHVTARTLAGADTTAITLNEANKFSTAAGADVTVYKTCEVNGAYAAGYAKGITLDGYASGKAPQVGQLLSFGTGGSRHTYTVIESEDAGSTCVVYLDRPLTSALVDDQAAFPGPAGSLNWAFHKNCVALVTRPLARPAAGLGALSAVVPYNDVAMRVVMQYDAESQGTRVNMDILAGVAVLDTDLCIVLQG